MELVPTESSTNTNHIELIIPMYNQIITWKIIPLVSVQNYKATICYSFVCVYFARCNQIGIVKAHTSHIHSQKYIPKYAPMMPYAYLNIA